MADLEKLTFLKARNVGNRRYTEGETADFDPATAKMLKKGKWAKPYGETDAGKGDEAKTADAGKGGKGK